MNLLDTLTNEKEVDNRLGNIFGVVIGVVTNNQDPDNMGRVKVKFPWLSDEEESTWARIATLMGGKDRGFVFLPEVDDEVLVAFDHGDVRHPYILGAFWNGEDTIPKEKEGDDENNLRLIKSRSGHLFQFDDTDGSGKIEIIDNKGKNIISIDSSADKITITSEGDIEFLASNGKILLDGTSVEIKSSAEIKIESGSSMDVKASSTMTIEGSTVNIN